MITPSPGEYRSHYSRQLATQVVQRFTKKYARATMFVAQDWPEGPQAYGEYLIGLFMHDNRRWNKTRDALKRVQVRLERKADQGLLDFCS